MTAPALLAWSVEALVASGLLMAIVLLVRAPTRRAFGPQVAYALWALPALRLLLPSLPAAWREHAAMPIAAGEAVTVLALPADLPAAAVADLPWATIALAAWAIGAIAFFAFHLATHRRFCARLLRDARLVDEVDGVRVIESAAATGPLAFGLHRRFVVFPTDFAERYDADERELALLHELGHHRARDLLSNWAALGVLALHWFNPLAWRAFRAFRCDQELANDARVLAGRSRTDAHVYACAILKAAHGGHVSAACHLHTIADLKGRMRMLSRRRPSRRRIAAGATGVAALVATGLGLTASGTRAATAVSTGIGDAVGVDLAEQASPAAPAAPAVPAVPATPDKAAAHAVRRAIVHRAGKTRVYEGAAADAYVAANPRPTPHARLAPPSPIATPPSPQGAVTTIFDRAHNRTFRVMTPPTGERMCVDGVDGGPRQFVLKRALDGKNVTIICRNRIDEAAQEGTRLGVEAAEKRRTEHVRVRTTAPNARIADADLAALRAGIAADPSLSDERRRNALSTLDRALSTRRPSQD